MCGEAFFFLIFFGSFLDQAKKEQAVNGRRRGHDEQHELLCERGRRAQANILNLDAREMCEISLCKP
jgi:hypothetical protein